MNRRNTLPLFAAALAVVAVLPARALAASELDDVRDTQKKILERLDAQDKMLRDILQRVQSAPAGRPQMDPNRVYEIPVGGSEVRGAKQAAVTLVEFSDFQ